MSHAGMKKLLKAEFKNIIERTEYHYQLEIRKGEYHNIWISGTGVLKLQLFGSREAVIAQSVAEVALRIQSCGLPSKYHYNPPVTKVIEWEKELPGIGRISENIYSYNGWMIEITNIGFYVYAGKYSKGISTKTLEGVKKIVNVIPQVFLTLPKSMATESVKKFKDKGIFVDASGNGQISIVRREHGSLDIHVRKSSGKNTNECEAEAIRLANKMYPNELIYCDNQSAVCLCRAEGINVEWISRKQNHFADRAAQYT